MRLLYYIINEEKRAQNHFAGVASWHLSDMFPREGKGKNNIYSVAL